MAAPTIPNGEEHFFTTLYEGTGGGQRIGTFVPFTDNATIANSVLYNDDDSPYLTRTQESGSGDQKRKATFSWWFKRGSSFGTEMIHVGAAASTRLLVRFDTSDRLVFRLTNGTTEYQKITNRTFEDTSKWYHCHWQIDVSQSTATDRSKVWIDGDQITSWSADVNPAQNTDVVGLSDGTTQRIGCGAHFVGQIFDGYLAEFNYCDGVITTVDNFGITDTSTGRWIPKALTGITYGSNGFRLQFGSSSALGDDTSGNTNDFSSSGLVAGDQTTDSPTQNFATFDPLDSGNNAGATPGTAVLAEGNTRVTAPSNPSNWDQYRTSKPLLSGKFYCEVTLTSLNTATYFGVISKLQNIKGGGWYSDQSTGWSYDSSNGKTENSNDGYLSYGSARSQGDVVGIAVDLDNGKLWFSENGTYPNSGNPATGANPAYSNLKLAVQDGGLCFTEARGYSGHNDWNFGQKSFTHSAPSGFSTVQQKNMPETAKGIVGLNWIKDRDNGSYYQTWQDSNRGPNKEIYSNDTAQQASTNDSVTKFLKGGVAIEDAVNVNNSGDSFVSWNFVGNSGTTSSNGDGNVTCTLQLNDTAKFSIQTWTNTGAGTKTIGHGLGVKPGLIIQKRLDTTSNWFTYHHKLSGNGSYLHLNNTDQIQTGSDFANTEPTTSVFSSNASSSSSATFVSYCFAEVEGFSKFGHYIGNGVADGPFVYTGFKPAFIIFKASASSTNWYMHDAARSPINPVKALLDANTTAAESSSYVSNGVDFLSNGFKVRQPTGYGYNYTSQLVYIAFAEHPFVGDGTNPVTAR